MSFTLNVSQVRKKLTVFRTLLNYQLPSVENLLQNIFKVTPVVAVSDQVSVIPIVLATDVSKADCVDAPITSLTIKIYLKQQPCSMLWLLLKYWYQD